MNTSKDSMATSPCGTDANQQSIPTNMTLFLDRPIYILSLCGIWLPSYESIKIIYTIVIMLTQYSFWLFQFVYIINVLGDMDAVSEASIMLFTQASLCFKCTVFMVSKGNLVKLLQMMDTTIFKPQSKKHEKILEAQSRGIKRLCLIFMISAITTCSLWSLMPLFDKADIKSFPFKIWMPKSTESSPGYECGYLYQVISVYICALLFISVDSVAISMIMFGCAQLEIIMEKVQQLKSIPFSLKTKTYREELIRKNNELFVECIKQNQTLERSRKSMAPRLRYLETQFIQLMEDTYHANIFFQLICTVPNVCNIGLRIKTVSHNSVQFYSTLTYMVAVLAQLFLYCWCSNELTIRSENLRELLYQCPWYEQDSKFKRSLWIAMERMKKPLVVRAGHYIPLSRSTIVAVIRSSYSYFAVLNCVKNK